MLGGRDGDGDGDGDWGGGEELWWGVSVGGVVVWGVDKVQPDLIEYYTQSVTSPALFWLLSILKWMHEMLSVRDWMGIIY